MSVNVSKPHQFMHNMPYYILSLTTQEKLVMSISFVCIFVRIITLKLFTLLWIFFQDAIVTTMQVNVIMTKELLEKKEV